MSARLSSALLEDGSPVGQMCAKMKAAFNVLFRQAQEPIPSTTLQLHPFQLPLLQETTSS